MTKQEFEALIHGHITDKEWQTVDLVYTFHPAIKDAGGKDQIAKIFLAGGIAVMKDMHPTAMRAYEHDREIRALKAKIEKADEEFAEWYERRTA